MLRAKDSATDFFGRWGSEHHARFEIFEQILRHKADAGEDITRIDSLSDIREALEHDLPEHLRNSFNFSESPIMVKECSRSWREIAKTE